MLCWDEHPPFPSDRYPQALACDIRNLNGKEVLTVKNAKKWLSLSLAGVLLTGLLAGCGGGNTPPASSAPSAPVSTTPV